jgi:hypothetical protein
VPVSLSSRVAALDFNAFVVLTTITRCRFLPAGWFHEVVSSSSDGTGHFALNYWFHPPDVACVSGQDADGLGAAAKQ